MASATADSIEVPSLTLGPRERVEARADALLALPGAALALAGLALATRDGTHPEDALRAALLLVWAGAGTAMVSREPLRVLGRVVLGGVAVGAAAFAGTAAAGPAAWTGTGLDVARAAREVGLVVLVAVALHALLALPRGMLWTRARRTTVRSAYGLALAGGAAVHVASGEVPGWLLASLWALALGIGLPSANVAYRGSAGLDRQRMQWVGCAAALAGEASIVVGALHLLVDWPGDVGVVAGWSTALLPLALVAASSRLVARVDRLLVHTVSLTGVTAVVVAVYLVIVVGLGRVPEDAERQLLVLSMVAAAVAAVAYVPARERLAEAANRFVYGERHAPDEVLRTFGSRMTRAVPFDELLLQLAESLRKTMTLSRAEVWTGTPDLLERVVSVPDQPRAPLPIGPRERPVVARAGVSGNAWLAVWLPGLLEGRADRQVRVAPACHAGELLGLIVAERPAGGDVFGEEDDRVLTELARQVGLALHNAQLDSALQSTLDEVRRQAEELRASRARIVATADAERRKIERNLHDGAQQHLVALAVNLRLVKDLVGADPGTAAEMLDALADDVRSTIQELRDLAHGIYPPLLMDSGLGEALRAAAQRSPLDVDVFADVGRYPAEVEAAVYFCCLEALQNASKHADGAHVEVRLWEESGGVLFTVSDDGPGFDAEVARAGHGFVNMSDRLGAIGGTVRWDSTPGAGATVAGSVPVAAS